MRSVLATSTRERPTCCLKFPDIDDDAWRRALTTAQVMTIPAGTLAVRAGDPCDRLLLIESGTIRVSQRSPDGRTLTLCRASAGEMCAFTLQALMENRNYDVELLCEDEARVLCVPRQEFYRCMAESEAFRRFVVSVLTRRLCDLSQLVHRVAFVGLDLRLACLLGQLFGQRNTAQIQVTHLELADELGTSREVVSRLLKEFEHKGCLRLHRGSIELVAPDALARLSTTCEC